MERAWAASWHRVAREAQREDIQKPRALALFGVGSERSI